MSYSGQMLKERNDQICKCITEMKKQRSELNFLINKQQEEKLKLQTEIERITYKLSLITKSLSQRILTKTNYDKTIKQAEDNYAKLVESSRAILDAVQKEAEELGETMDKKIGTESKNSVSKEDSISEMTKAETIAHSIGNPSNKNTREKIYKDMDEFF